MDVPELEKAAKLEAAKMEADAAKVEVLETSTVGFVKLHYAVIGAIVCLMLGFIAGRLV
jgi:hypothetical protein